jgi:hypothetical protein
MPKLLNILKRPQISPRNNNNSKAVYYHLFYYELVIEAIETLNSFPSDYDKIITINENFSDGIVDLIYESTGALVAKTKNTGRDIYPLWVLVQEGIFDRYEIVCKLHGKKSKHRTDGDLWRKTALQCLAGDVSRIRFIEKLFRESSEPLSFVCPEPFTIKQSTVRNWLSNMENMNLLLSRKGVTSTAEQCGGMPIMAGSFYWFNSLGLSKFKVFPVDAVDWDENAKITDGIDGLLEHAIERALTINGPLFTNNPGKVAMVGKNEEISYLPLPSIEEDGSVTYSELKATYIGHEPAVKHHDILGYYQSEFKNNVLALSGWSIDLNALASKLQLEVLIDGKKVGKVISNVSNERFKMPGIFNGECGFSFEMIIPSYEKLEVKVTDKLVYLSTENETLLVSAVLNGITVQELSVGSVMSPEQQRVTTLPITKELRETKPYHVIRKYLKTYQDGVNGITKNENDKLHVFFVNNPISQIAVARIIDNKKLNGDNVLILLHRMENATLLDSFDTIKTELPDIEQVHNRENVEKVIKLVDKLALKLANSAFDLYAHHYFSLITYLLAWFPNCKKTNVFEEGNLSSVDKFQEERDILNKLFSNSLPLIEKLNNSERNNNVLSLVSGVTYDHISHGFIKDHFPSLLDEGKHFLATIPFLFDVENSLISKEKLASLLCFRRYYFWHPKMLLGGSAFSISKAFKTDNLSVKYLAPSDKEIALRSIYKEKLNTSECKYLMLLPVYGRFGLFETSTALKIYKQMSKTLASNTSNKIHYLLHPADPSKEKTVKRLEDVIGAQIDVANINLVNLQHELGESSLVTEIAASLFDNIVHYGSSVSLTLPQYHGETMEILVSEFK